MTLFATIQQSSNALQVSQLGLHVVGNNIANANTPGYIRQELIQVPAVGGKFGDVIIGYGVRAVGVQQKLDQFVVERLRDTQSGLASSQALTDVYDRLESVFGELSDNDLSSQLADFSSSIHDVLNQPGNDALRRLVIERGKSLTTNIRSTRDQLLAVTQDLNSQIQRSAEEINRLTEKLGTLNQRIVELEGGKTGTSDAVGLRDERHKVLSELSQTLDIRAVEQGSGAVTVFVGGEYLVSEGLSRQVKSATSVSGDFPAPEIRLVDTDSPLQVQGGRLHGLYAARDGAVGSVLTALDQFAQDLITQFNRIHTQGQGVTAFSEVTGTYASDDPLGALDLSGLPVEVVNGEFGIQVIDTTTGLSDTHRIRINLQGETTDTSLDDVRGSIDAISGLNATLTTEGALRISADNSKLEFAFQNDSSNFLAAAGINTFFDGDSAGTIRLNAVVAADPQKLAASLTGVGSATGNALQLANAFDEPLAALNGKSIKQAYEDLVVGTTEDINLQAGITDGLKNFYRTLEGQHLAVSGVNLDEEAVKMIFYQRAFQASSKVIQTSNEMLDVLVNL